MELRLEPVLSEADGTLHRSAEQPREAAAPTGCLVGFFFFLKAQKVTVDVSTCRTNSLGK